MAFAWGMAYATGDPNYLIGNTVCTCFELSDLADPKDCPETTPGVDTCEIHIEQMCKIDEVPEPDKGTCKISDDIIMAPGGTFYNWGTKDDDAELTITDNGDGSFTSSLPVFYPGNSASLMYMLKNSADPGNSFALIAPDCDGVVMLVEDATLKSSYKSGKKAGSDNKKGWTVTYEATGPMPNIYCGSIL